MDASLLLGLRHRLLTITIVPEYVLVHESSPFLRYGELSGRRINVYTADKTDSGRGAYDR